MSDSEMSDPQKVVPAWRARLHIDPVAALLAIIGIGVAIYLAVRPAEYKQMALISNGLRPLININAQNPILYRGKEVASPWIFSRSLTNTGNTPIDAGDVENNKMTIKFPNVTVLRQVITSVQPKDIIASIDAAGDTVELSHKLMNPGDTISFDVILSGDPGDFSDRLVPQLARAPVAVARAWHQRVGLELGKKSGDHGVANRRRRDIFPLAVADEPAQSRLHALVR